MKLRMYLLITVAVAFSALCGGLIAAYAADVPAKAPTVVRASLWDWSGWYLGADFGGSWGTGDSSLTFGKTTITGNTSPNGFVYGGHIGGRKELANGVVLGARATWLGSAANDSATVSGFPKGFPTVTKKDSFSSVLLAEGEVGYAMTSSFGPWLPYVSGGSACVTSKTTLAVAGGGSVKSSGSDNCGWTIGAGVDWATSFYGMIVGIKYNYADFGKAHPSFALGGSGAGLDITETQKLNMVMLNGSLKF